MRLTKTFASVCFLLVATMLLITPAQSKAESADAWVHYFVISKTLPDGTPADMAIAKLRVELVKLAGGYTDMGTVMGQSMGDGGKINTQHSVCFMVSADEDISKELSSLIAKLFQKRKAFMLVWKAERVS